MSANRMAATSATYHLEDAYVRTLEQYLSGQGEKALGSAYEIGRSALTDGLGVLEMAAMHHVALTKILHCAHTAAIEDRLDRAKEIFDESLSPYEMANRGFRDAIAALQRLNEVLEQEIQRIAHTVHDDTGQLLVAARLAISGVAHDLPPALQERLQEVNSFLDQVDNQLRNLSHELRPTILDDLGLVAALQFLADRISGKSYLLVKLQASSTGRYAPGIETAVYRIVQEALTNIVRHAQAKTVRIKLFENAGNLCCRINDDGRGFDVPAVLVAHGHRGLGLLGIRERLHAIGGSLQINSTPGKGTELLVKIPTEK